MMLPTGSKIHELRVCSVRFQIPGAGRISSLASFCRSFASACALGQIQCNDCVVVADLMYIVASSPADLVWYMSGFCFLSSQ